MLEGGEMQVVAFSLLGQLQNFGDEPSRWTFHSRIPVCLNLEASIFSAIGGTAIFVTRILEFLKNSIQELS